MKLSNIYSKEGPIALKTYQFSIKIIQLNKRLKLDEYALSNQLLRSGTCVGAMAREAQNAESGKDFIHKFAIAHKEAAEAIYWIDLLFETGYISEEEHTELRELGMEIVKMISKTLITVRSKRA